MSLLSKLLHVHTEEEAAAELLSITLGKFPGLMTSVVLPAQQQIVNRLFGSDRDLGMQCVDGLTRVLGANPGHVATALEAAKK